MSDAAGLAPSLTYRLFLPKPEAHLVDVEVEIRRPPEAIDAAAPIDLTMAAWSPGSYLIRDYARFVRHVKASSSQGSLSVRKLDKQTWRVSPTRADCITVAYQVYGHDLTVRTNHIDGTHAFLHGPATYLMVEGWRDVSCTVEVHAPLERGWSVATGLPERDDPARADVAVFCADDADHLLDCPIHVGEASEHAFEVLGTPMRLVIWGLLTSGGVADVERLITDLQAIVEQHGRRLGGHIPCERYTFILMLSPGGYGGLEHKNSSANLHSPLCLASTKNYHSLLELLSHEFFHVWNGKRIFPEALHRFDYTREAYTRCLWVMEGLTSYYDRYTLLGASCIQPKHFLKKLAEEWSRYQGIPGRDVHSLEDASFDAWIKLYKPDESNLNTTVSYYLAGGLVAMTLDLEIRHRTGGQRSLDDVLNLLWTRYGQAGVPYPEDVLPVFEEATGLEMGVLFDRVVRGCEQPDVRAALALVGLEMTEGHDSDGDDAETSVWLGITASSQSLRIRAVLDGSPAAQAGLSPGDSIIATDGLQVSSESELSKRLSTKAPGDTLAVALFRRRILCHVDVPLASAPPKRVTIAGMEAPSPAQRALFKAWMGQEHPGAGKIASAKGVRWL